MSLQASHKIKRFLRICQACRLYSNIVTNPKYLAELSNKSTEKTQKNKQINFVDASINSQKDQDKPVFDDYPVLELEQNDLQQLRRRFAKSSTQIALTQPLKLPRLANPFPDPVKTLRSDTIADDEKARLMQEEVKMEARYYLQMQQEKLLQEKMNKMAQEQNINIKDNNYEQQSQCNMSMNNVKKKQPTYRKPKDYNELQKEQCSSQCNSTSNPDQFNNQNSEFKNQNLNRVNGKHDLHDGNNIIKASTLNNPPKSEEKKKKKQRKRCRSSRSSCHLKASRRRPHTNPYSTYLNRRFFSSKSNSINPEIINETEQAEIILKRLKTLYPEYKHLKKPVFVSGDEEKQFINHILKLLGKHKTEAQKVTKACAPFPSYSEMKTYAQEVQPNKQENINNSNSDSNIRYYHTKNDDNVTFMDPMPKKVKKLKHVPYMPSKPQIVKRVEAPYPAFSETNDNYYTDMSPWRSDTCFTLTTNKKFYSTISKDETEKQAKKKPPCKNPFPPLPECDYVEQARKNEERKKRKGRCPGNKNKKCSAEDDENTIVNKIKVWLNSCKPNAENIKIIRAPIDVDGRETYVIELHELKEVKTGEYLALGQKKTGTTAPTRNIDYKPNECKQSHVTELTDNIPVISKNIPDFNSNQDFTSGSIRKPEDLSKNKKKTESVSAVVRRPDLSMNKKNSEHGSVSIRRPEELSTNKKKTDTLPESSSTSNLNSNSVFISKSLIPVNSKPEETRINDNNMEKIKQILERKFYDSSKINKVKGHLQVQSRVKKIEKINNDNVDIKCKLFRNYKFKKIKLKKTSKPKQIAAPKEDFNYYNERIDNKYKEIIRETNYLPEPCPTITKPVLSFSPKKKDKCKKKKTPEECPKKKKCRYKKKRKLPSCDDVPGNKTCMPFYISELERNYMPQNRYMSYNNNKVNIKKSEHTNLKGGEVAVLANQNSMQEAVNNEPFKLKPQFWRK